MLKDLVKKTLLTKAGKINARKTPYLIQDNIELYNLIITETNFLPEESSLIERLTCILNDITSLPQCPICSKKRSYVLYRGYKDTCGTNSCGLKLRYLNEKNKKNTGAASLKVKEDNRIFYESNWNNTDNLNLQLPEQIKIRANYTSRQNILNWLSIIQYTKELWPLIDKPSYFELQARYEIYKNGLPYCTICNKAHARFSKKTGKLLDTCSEQCTHLKLQNNNIDKYKQILLQELDDFEIIEMDNFISKKPVKLKCKNNHIFERYLHGVYRHNIVCPNCTPLGSSYEQEIVDWLKKLGITNIIQNTKKIIAPYELDIYLPELNIAIEFHGNYWHSFNKSETPDQKQYHQMKYLKCKEQNIKLIQIFEFEWQQKQELLKHRLQHILGFSENKVYARKCIIEEIDKAEANNFLQKYHFQGSENRSCIFLGLRYNDELVAVMSFGKPRFNTKFEWELIRYTTKYNIVGGANKLYSYFIKIYNPLTIISYSDNRFGFGTMYNHLKMTMINISKPNYFYIKDNIVLSRYLCQKHKLKTLLPIFDNSLSEQENMFNNKYRRIWDAGTTIWTYTK